VHPRPLFFSWCTHLEFLDLPVDVGAEASIDVALDLLIEAHGGGKGRHLQARKVMVVGQQGGHRTLLTWLGFLGTRGSSMRSEGRLRERWLPFCKNNRIGLHAGWQ
jgi:hypothetical protein